MRSVFLSPLVPLAILSTAYGCAPAAPTSTSRPIVLLVPLGKPIDRIQGAQWPASAPETHAIEKPARLRVVFPDGLDWSTYSAVTIIDQHDGRIRRVVATPLTKPESFPMAVTEATTIVRALGGDRDPQASARLREWSAGQADLDTFGAKTLGFPRPDGYEVFLTIRPYDFASTWLISVEVSRPTDRG
jgi:hypothetical protein